MRSQIDTSVIVIMLMTPSYMASAFCQAEMGAAWVKATDVFPIVVPPTTFEEVRSVMLGKQAISIEDNIRFNDLREQLTNLVNFTPVKPTRWDLKRNQFFGALPGHLANIAKPPIVQAKTHQELETKYNDVLKDLGEQEKEIEKLKIKIAELEKLKDAAGVAKVNSQFTNTEVGTEFEHLAAAAKHAIKKMGAPSVRRLYLADHYGKPFDLQNFDHEDFDAAIRRNVLSDDCKPRSGHREVSAADRALSQMEKFIKANFEDLEGYSEEHYTSPLETDNEDFWNEHLL